MSFSWNFLDSNGLTLYGLVFNSSNQAFNTTTSGFSSYSDSNITNFNINMTETATRLGHYYGYINEISGFSKGIYQVEIYQRIGGTPDKDTDILRGVGNVYWNGNIDVPSIGVPRLEDASNIGQIGLDETIAFTIEAHDIFGMVSNVDGNLRYHVYSGTSPMNISGNMTNLDVGRYGASFAVTSGTFIYDIPYAIRISGSINNTVVSTSKTFDIKSPAIFEGTINTDVLTQLGYPTGAIQSVSSTTEFTTNLVSTVDGTHNGSILRITSTGNLYGVGRIIYNYNGITKGITLNKALPALPSVNTTFVIFPIGGQLNVT